MTIAPVIPVALALGVGAAGFAIDAAETPGIDGLNQLAGSPFVALVVCFLAVIVLWRALEQKSAELAALHESKDKEARERWEAVGKMAEALRESNAIRRDEFSSYGRRG